MQRHAALVVPAILIAFVLACRNEPRATTPSVPPPPAAATLHGAPVDTAVIDSLIRATVRERGLVGLSVGVAQDGKIVFAKGYGVLSLSRRDAITRETMFAVGSVTKQFTCSAVLLLAQDGKLSLTDHVAKYMPHLT